MAVALAGTRPRLFNQDDPVSIWMACDDDYTLDLVLNIFAYYELKPINVRFVSDRHTQKFSGYCFVDFATPSECIHAMLRIMGQEMPMISPPKVFGVAFARNPRHPEVHFVIRVSGLPRGTQDWEIFKVFLQRYPSCRGAHVTPASESECNANIFMADYFEQQQGAEDLDCFVFHGHRIRCRACDPRIKLPKHMVNTPEGNAFIESAHVQISQLAAQLKSVKIDEKYRREMAKLEKISALARTKFDLTGAPVPPSDLNKQWEPIIYHPSPTVEQLNELEMNFGNRLQNEIRDSRFLKRGFYLDAMAHSCELSELYDAEE